MSNILILPHNITSRARYRPNVKEFALCTYYQKLNPQIQPVE